MAASVLHGDRRGGLAPCADRARRVIPRSGGAAGPDELQCVAIRVVCLRDHLDCARPARGRRALSTTREHDCCDRGSVRRLSALGDSRRGHHMPVAVVRTDCRRRLARILDRADGAGRGAGGAAGPRIRERIAVGIGPFCDHVQGARKRSMRRAGGWAGEGDGERGSPVLDGRRRRRCGRRRRRGRGWCLWIPPHATQQTRSPQSTTHGNGRPGGRPAGVTSRTCPPRFDEVAGFIARAGGADRPDIAGDDYRPAPSARYGRNRPRSAGSIWDRRPSCRPCPAPSPRTAPA